MKTVQRLLALGLFVCGTCVFAGCGAETAPKPDTTPAAETGSGDADADTDGSDTSATTPATQTPASEDAGEMQLVSLKVPNMT